MDNKKIQNHFYKIYIMSKSIDNQEQDTTATVESLDITLTGPPTKRFKFNEDAQSITNLDVIPEENDGDILTLYDTALDSFMRFNSADRQLQISNDSQISLTNTASETDKLNIAASETDANTMVLRADGVDGTVRIETGSSSNNGLVVRPTDNTTTDMNVSIQKGTGAGYENILTLNESAATLTTPLSIIPSSDGSIFNLYGANASALLTSNTTDGAVYLYNGKQLRFVNNAGNTTSAYIQSPTTTANRLDIVSTGSQSTIGLLTGTGSSSGVVIQPNSTASENIAVTINVGTGGSTYDTLFVFTKSALTCYRPIAFSGTQVTQSVSFSFSNTVSSAMTIRVTKFGNYVIFGWDSVEWPESFTAISSTVVPSGFGPLNDASHVIRGINFDVESFLMTLTVANDRRVIISYIATNSNVMSGVIIAGGAFMYPQS